MVVATTRSVHLTRATADDGRLDTAVEAFAHSVGNAVTKVGERVFDVFFEHFGYLGDRLELAARCPAIPLIEKLAGIACVFQNTQNIWTGPKTNEIAP